MASKVDFSLAIPAKSLELYRMSYALLTAEHVGLSERAVKQLSDKMFVYAQVACEDYCTVRRV